jgi:branched-chain amino acid transport system permease protein
MDVAQFIIYGLINGALYGLVALGLALAFGIMGYLNVAHGDLIMLAAYGSFWLFKIWHVDPFLSIPLMMVVMFAAGVLLYVAVFSHLAKFPILDRLKNSILVSFGLIMVFTNMATVLWTADERCTTPFYSGMVIDIAGLRLPYIGLATIALAIIITLALHMFLTKTYFGKAIRATAQDWEAAELMGIDIARTYLFSFAFAIATAGIAGAVISTSVVSPSIGMDWTNYGLVLVILAGVGNIDAILPAGLLLGVVEAISVYLAGVPYTGVAGLVMFVLVLMLRPQGLFRGRAAL